MIDYEQKIRDLRTTCWSCGGGVDSTAIAVLICTGKLPKPDLAIMVDVGYEKKSTWEHVLGTLVPRLDEVGVKLEIVETRKYTDNGLIDPQGRVAIPAYRKNVDGSVSKMHTWCNGKWKAQVTRRWLREQGVRRVEQWLGMAADETRRARPSDRAWIVHRWPLIEMGLTREGCCHAIGCAGWPMPPRTSCYLCPQQSNREWQQMAEHEAEEFAKAQEAERWIQERHKNVFLHSKCEPIGTLFRSKPLTAGVVR